MIEDTKRGFMQRKLLAIVAADMVGFSRLVENNEIEILKYSGLKNSKILLYIDDISWPSQIKPVSLFLMASSAPPSFPPIEPTP